MNTGRINVSQFRKALDALQISSVGRLWLVEPEIDALITLYKAENDPDYVCWRIFEDDIDQGTILYIMNTIFNIFNEHFQVSYFVEHYKCTFLQFLIYIIFW